MLLKSAKAGYWLVARFFIIMAIDFSLGDFAVAIASSIFAISLVVKPGCLNAAKTGAVTAAITSAVKTFFICYNLSLVIFNYLSHCSDLLHSSHRRCDCDSRCSLFIQLAYCHILYDNGVTVLYELEVR